jgi:acyl-CoA thioester hydrolase
MREIIIEEQDEKEGLESLYVRRANYYETDKMGIIHHSNYIRWFEEARIHYMEEIGCPLKEVEDMGIMIPVLSVDCQYKTMVRYGDTVNIYTKITRFTGVKMTVSYRVLDSESGELRCTGETGHCFLNADYRPVRMKREYPELYEIFMSHVAVE